MPQTQRLATVSATTLLSFESVILRTAAKFPLSERHQPPSAKPRRRNTFPVNGTTNSGPTHNQVVAHIQGQEIRKVGKSGHNHISIQIRALFISRIGPPNIQRPVIISGGVAPGSKTQEEIKDKENGSRPVKKCDTLIIIIIIITRMASSLSRV